MERELDLPDEDKQRIKEDDTSMNKELLEWLKETKEETKEIKRMKKTSKKDEKKPAEAENDDSVEIDELLDDDKASKKDEKNK